MKTKHVVLALVISCVAIGSAWADEPTLMGGDSNTLGKTGGGTLGKTGGGTLAADPSSPAFTAALDSDTLSGAGSVKVTLDAAPNPAMPPEASGAYDIPLTSSDQTCTVPDFVTMNWSSDKGGNASFDVTCTAAASAHVVTITAGNAAVGLLVKP